MISTRMMPHPRHEVYRGGGERQVFRPLLLCVVGGFSPDAPYEVEITPGRGQDLANARTG